VSEWHHADLFLAPPIFFLALRRAMVHSPPCQQGAGGDGEKNMKDLRMTDIDGNKITLSADLNDKAIAQGAVATVETGTHNDWIVRAIDMETAIKMRDYLNSIINAAT
jgi:hypothetical protein